MKYSLTLVIFGFRVALSNGVKPDARKTESSQGKVQQERGCKSSSANSLTAQRASAKMEHFLRRTVEGRE